MNVGYSQKPIKSSLRNIPIAVSVLYDQEYLQYLASDNQPRRKERRRSQSEKNYNTYTSDICRQQQQQVLKLNQCDFVSVI